MTASSLKEQRYTHSISPHTQLVKHPLLEEFRSSALHIAYNVETVLSQALSTLDRRK
jgi:hypothetical protein